MASASALAQLFGQLVSFVGTVALARLLTPTDVGIFVAGTVLPAEAEVIGTVRVYGAQRQLGAA